MLESEKTVHERARGIEELPRRVCRQLLADPMRYSLWRVRHEASMHGVAAHKRRDLQILKLRAVAVEQVHRTALVRYLHDHQITGTAREHTLREFYGVLDTKRASIAEHRNYLVAASTQLCTADLLDLTGDDKGLDLIRGYENLYGQYFSMFCDKARAARVRKPYVLGSLLPEAKTSAERLRDRILDGDLLPPRQVSYARAS
jgi:hypothetical protein